jgi:hypothetical protein
VLTYIAAVTTNGRSTTVVKEDELPHDQKTQYDNAEALASGLLSAMQAESQRRRHVEDDLDPAEVFPQVLSGLVQSNAAHSRTQLHWLNPFTFARDFPEVAQVLASGGNYLDESDDESSDENDQGQLVQRLAPRQANSSTPITRPGATITAFSELPHPLKHSIVRINRLRAGSETFSDDI